MPYLFRFTSEAQEDLEALDNIVKQRIGKKILYFENAEDIKKVSKKLINFEIGEYRLRVGDYRIIFDIINPNIILITAVKHRRNSY